MALIIMGSSGGRCDRSGSALPVITMHAAGGARGASSVSAAINMTAQRGALYQRTVSQNFETGHTLGRG